MDLNDLELLIKSPKDYILKYFNDSRETITALYKTRKETKLTNELSIKLDENYKLLYLGIFFCLVSKTINLNMIIKLRNQMI